MNGRLITVEGRTALRFERGLDHSVERVWRAISEPEELRRWYPGVPVWELEPGASFTNESGPGRRTDHGSRAAQTARLQLGR